MATILITGGTGCIGSATTYKLLQSDQVEKIFIATRSANTQTLKLWLGEELDPRIEFIRLDISDYQVLENTVLSIDPTHIIHLGAFQSPDCAAYHSRGMEINTGGTMALFDTAEKLNRLERFVFASSGAVYGMRSMYPQATIPENVPLAPPNHYGIWKLAGEHLARLFYDSTGIPTISLRLNTTYGLGRDQGMTSAPTTAMKNIAKGAAQNQIIPFAMPYQGRENYHFVEDVGHHFAACTLQPFTGCEAFNIKGQTIEIASFLQSIREEAEKLGLNAFTEVSIREGAPPNLFICDLNHDKIEGAFSTLPLTDISTGIRKSLQVFRELAERELL